MNTTRLVEHDEFWLVPLAEATLTQCRVDHQLTLVFSAFDHETTEIVLAVPFRYRSPDGRACDLDPEKQVELGPALGLFGQDLSRVTVWKDGKLELEFANRASIVVRPHPDYEAWGLTGPGSLKLVCLPGGGEPAIWT